MTSGWLFLYRQTGRGKHTSVPRCLSAPHYTLPGPAAGRHCPQSETWVSAAMSLTLCENKPQLDGLCLSHRSKARKDCCSRNKRKYMSGSHCIYSIFAHGNRHRYKNTKLVRLLSCSLQALVCSLTTPPTFLWFPVQTGSTDCPQLVENTCSYERCQDFLPSVRPHGECDAEGAKCNSMSKKTHTSSQSLGF